MLGDWNDDGVDGGEEESVVLVGTNGNRVDTWTSREC